MKFRKKIKIDGVRYYREHERAFITAFFDNVNNEEYETLKKMINNEKVELTLEIEEPILDDVERKYLSGVIRPFRDRVKCIKKEKDFNKREYITITYDDDWLIPLPFFENNTMYKGMEINKEYTLEELGL